MIIPMKKWSELNTDDRRALAGQLPKVMGAIQHYASKQEKRLMTPVDEMAVVSEMKAQAQNFGADKFPDAVLNIIRTFQQSPETASNWTAFFEVLDFTNSNKNGFQIADIAMGLAFDEVPIGQKIKLYTFTGQKATVEFIRYGGGMGWDSTLFDDREFLTLDNIAQEFTLKALNHKNDLAFSLLNAMLTGGTAHSSVTEIPWQDPIPSGLATSDANYVAIRDMQTIDKAVSTVIEQNKGKGYGVTETTEVTMMFPVALRSRVLRALGILNAGISGSFRQVLWNVRPIMTTDMSRTDELLFGIPGKKTLWGNRMPLTVFNKFDPSSYSEAAYGWMRYAGAIGDFEQFVVAKTA